MRERARRHLVGSQQRGGAAERALTQPLRSLEKQLQQASKGIGVGDKLGDLGLGQGKRP